LHRMARGEIGKQGKCLTLVKKKSISLGGSWSIGLKHQTWGGETSIVQKNGCTEFGSQSRHNIHTSGGYNPKGLK